MYSQRVKEVMDRRKLVTVRANESVTDVARLMEQRRVGAVIVVDHRIPIGIFTERDALFRVIAQGRDPVATCVGDVMTPDPKTIAPDDSFGAALVAMHDNGFRHLPVVKDGFLLGIISSRSALDPDLEEFRCEEVRRKHFRRERGAAA
jgi:CBS domain-containing protein